MSREKLIGRELSIKIICQGTRFAHTLTYKMMRISDTIGDHHSALSITSWLVFISIVLHRRKPYLKNFVGQVEPQALPDAYEATKFLLRSD